MRLNPPLPTVEPATASRLPSRVRAAGPRGSFVVGSLARGLVLLAGGVASLSPAAWAGPAPAPADRRLDALAGTAPAPSESPLAFPDREGGALVAWKGEAGVYAARVRPADAASGNPGAGRGIPDTPVLVPGTDSIRPGSLQGVEDGSGGAILTWVPDSRGTGDRLEIVRLDADGQATARASFPGIGDPGARPVADGLGGLIVAHRASPDAAPTLERFDSLLQPAWTARGFAPRGARVAAVATDRVGGAFVAWLDGTASGFPGSLRAQRVDEFGWTIWAGEGVELAGAGAGPDDLRSVSAVADHNGGLFVAWIGASGFTVRHLDRDGNTDVSADANANAESKEHGGARATEFIVEATGGSGLLYSMLAPRAGSGLDLLAGLRGATPEAAPLLLAGGLPAGSRLAALVPDGTGGGSAFWISPRESGRELLSRRWLASGEVTGPDGGRVIAASLPGAALAPERAFSLALGDRGRGVLAWTAPGVFARPFVAPTVAQTKDVDIGNFFFSPANVDIAAGDTVQWHFVNGSHTTTSGSCSGASCTNSGVWGSPRKTGGTFSFTFTTAGSFDYFCAVHGASMQGNVSVTGVLPLSCDPTATPASGEAELSVGFNSNIAGGTPPYTIAWDFGDGGSSTAPAPSHTYIPAGDYMASLAMSDSDGSLCSDTVAVSVTPCVGRALTSLTVKAKKKVKVTLLGAGFQSGDRLQIDAGGGFVDVPGTKVKPAKITAKDTTAVFPEGVPVQFRVLQANNCSSASLPAQR